jgi:hypothetical protein
MMVRCREARRARPGPPAPPHGILTVILHDLFLEQEMAKGGDRLPPTRQNEPDVHNQSCDWAMMLRVGCRGGLGSLRFSSRMAASLSELAYLIYRQKRSWGRSKAFLVVLWRHHFLRAETSHVCRIACADC